MMLSITIPVLNEIKTLGSVIAKATCVLPAVPKQIIIVDDGSYDGTREWLQHNFPAGKRQTSQISLDIAGNLDFAETDGPRVDFVVLFHEATRGKGLGLRTAFAVVEGDVVVIQDADLEYDPADWQTMYDLIAVRAVADVVYGSRFMGAPRRALANHHYGANRLISLLFSFFFNRKLTDVETCYKMMSRKVLQSLVLTADDFGVEIEITAQIVRNPRWRIYEVAVSYYGRVRSEGKKINWKDGFKALWYVVKFRFSY